MLPGGVANAACTAGRTVSDEGLDGLALACTRTWAQQAEGLQGTHIRWLTGFIRILDWIFLQFTTPSGSPKLVKLLYTDRRGWLANW